MVKIFPIQLDFTSISGVFFDFDGVLVDSVDLKLLAYEEIFSPYGSEAVKEIRDYHLKNGGIDRYRKIEYVLTKMGLPLSLKDNLVDSFAHLVKEKVIASDSITPGLNLAMELHSKDIPSFIVSGTPEIELREIVERRNWSSLFTGVYGSPDTKETIVNRLIEKYNLIRNQCVFLGDAQTDFLCAQNTKLWFIGITEAFRDIP